MFGDGIFLSPKMLKIDDICWPFSPHSTIPYADANRFNGRLGNGYVDG